MSAPTSPDTGRGAGLPGATPGPAYLRGPFTPGKMQMTAKDWTLLRDRDGNRIVKHRLGVVVAIVFGEDDEMETQRAVLLAADPQVLAALKDMVEHFGLDGMLSGPEAAALAAARQAIVLAGCSADMVLSTELSP